jgi:hypothetical protein
MGAALAWKADGKRRVMAERRTLTRCVDESSMLFVACGPHLAVTRLKWGIAAKSAAPLAAIELGFEALAP